MFFIPGILISILTFPGVIVHELAHQLFCRLSRVPVYEVCYFRFTNPCGYVIHERTDNPWKNLLIAIGPFIINTILGAAILVPVSIEIWEFHSFTNPLTLCIAWLGISILVNSFPSSGDAKSLFENVIRNKKINFFVKAAVFPIVGIIYIGAIGSIVWLDFFYALGIGVLLPTVISLFI